MFLHDYNKEKRSIAAELHVIQTGARESEDITNAFKALTEYLNYDRDSAPKYRQGPIENVVIEKFTHMLLIDLNITEDIVLLLQRVIALGRKIKPNS